MKLDNAKLLEKVNNYRRYNRLEFFEPYAKQLEFIAMAREKNERCLFAGNRMGKTEVGAYEMACHLTGLYPDDWPGRKWDRPIKAWVGGVSTETNRNVTQAKLFGEPGLKD